MDKNSAGPENPTPAGPATVGLVRRRRWFAGAVQGVGFRATAVRLANRRGLAGWVRNLPNGEVELAVEGAETAVDGFLGELASAFPGISGIRGHDEPPDRAAPGFDFRR